MLKWSAEIISSFSDSSPLRPALDAEDDTTKNANPVAVLSYSYWRTRFGGVRDVLARQY